MKNEIFICHHCPMTRTMATLGTKWKSIIIYAIGLRQVRFGVLHAKIGLISKKVLTSQLRELEEDGIVTRQVIEELPLRVEYGLTPSGQELLPILNQLTLWNKKHLQRQVKAAL